MPEEVFPGIFRIEVPLPNNPLRSINSYVIPGSERSLVIDTGMNRAECKEALLSGIRDIGIDLDATDVLVTHMHADHLGLAPELTRGRTRVLMGTEDIAVIDEKDYWDLLLKGALENGFPSSDPQGAIRLHPGYRYGPLGPMDLRPLKDGDIVHAGGFEFKAVHTKGHTRGHMCLYEPRSKLLFSGDHILGDITPNITFLAGEGDPLSDYIRNLKKVRSMDIDIVLPGHRGPVIDHRARIDELLRHHDERAREAEENLPQGGSTGFEVARSMSWDLDIDDFDRFPLMQKWFALGETVAHLRYLLNLGRVERWMEGGLFKYQRVNNKE